MQSHLASLQLIKYFMITLGYRPVVLQSQKDEIFLEKVEDKKIQLIRITPEESVISSQVDVDESRINTVSKKIKKKLFYSKINVLNIYTSRVNLENAECKFDNIESVSILGVNKKGNTLSTFFKDAKDAIVPSDDPDKEMSIITKEISDHNMSVAKRHSKFLKNSPVPFYKVFLVVFVAMWVYINLVVPYGSLYTARQVIFSHGGLSKALMLSLGEWWRPITSSLTVIGILPAILGVILILILGKKVEGYYGFIRMFVISIVGMFASAYALMYFSGVSQWFGILPVVSSWVGAAVAFGITNRTMATKSMPSYVVPFLIFIMFLLWQSSTSIVVGMAGVTAGLFTARTISWKGKMPGPMAILDLVVLTALIITPLALMKYEGKQLTEYKHLDINDFDSYEKLNKDPIAIGKKVCEYYEVSEEDCLWK